MDLKRPSKKLVQEIILRGKYDVGINEWDISWAWGDCEYEGDIEIRFTEKSALITLDYKKIPNQKILVRTIYHELLHCILEPIERGASDFAEYYIKDPKAKSVFYEQLNTRQNETIDHIVTKILCL